MDCGDATKHPNGVGNEHGSSGVQNTKKAESIGILKKLLNPGDKIYTEVTTVSRSKTARHIKFFMKDENGRMDDISEFVADALGRKRDEMGVNTKGVGQDMTFFSVTRLSNALYGDENALKNIGLAYSKDDKEYFAEGVKVNF